MNASQSEYGPSLPQLVAPRWRGASGWQKGLALLMAGALIAAAFAYYLDRHSALADFSYPGSRVAPPFTVEYEAPLRRAQARGSELLRLEQRRAGSLVQSISIAPLRFRDRQGLVAGRLPLDAVSYRRAAARRLGGYRPVLEGATRVRGVQGYQLAFTGRSRTRQGLVRALFGKIVLVPEELARPRRGLAIQMLATTASGTRDPLALGNEGPLKTAYRSLELGS